MSDVENASGNVVTADNFRNQARGVIDDIAAHAGEIQDVFLGQPVVVQLVGET